MVSLLRWSVYLVIKVGLSILCRTDAQGMERVPARGPLIVVSNHTGSLEVPMLFAQLWPRPVTGWAKAETWEKPFFNWLFTLWGAIPVRRGEADMSALRAALEKLEQGYLLGVAPEGTRNRPADRALGRREFPPQFETPAPHGLFDPRREAVPRPKERGQDHARRAAANRGRDDVSTRGAPARGISRRVSGPLAGDDEVFEIRPRITCADIRGRFVNYIFRTLYRTTPIANAANGRTLAPSARIDVTRNFVFFSREIRVIRAIRDKKSPTIPTMYGREFSDTDFTDKHDFFIQTCKNTRSSPTF
ncbi:MAG: hypothetical protein DCC54_07685 [Anaerolineae bacterium]|nr:MAG: hypothetical protein DCC54_07685 [Anaerolineae bacterium]